jgi:peroxiredoxin
MASKRIVLLIAITVLLIASTAVPALALLPNGQAAPNFQLNDLSGTAHKLSDYRGKVVVIDFFGYACSACITDAKTNLVPLYSTYYKNDANVQFLGVEVDGSSAADIQQFVQAAGVPWPVGSGGSSVGPAYQVVSTPTLYVISPAGDVALSMQYPTNVQTLKSTIDALQGNAPAACFSGTANTLDLFTKGAGNYLYWKHSPNGGTTWGPSQSLGGALTSSPAATSRNPGGITVFARGSDGAVWYRDYVGGSWGNWVSIGGQTPVGTGPAVCSWGAGRLDVFVEGTNGGLYHKWYTGTAWSNWEYLGGALTSSPAATSRNPGGITVFVRGNDGGVWYRDCVGGSWGKWVSIGGQSPAGTGPAVCSWGGGRLDVFARGTDGAMWHRTWTDSAGWSKNWDSIGGVLTSGPATTSPASGVIDVFVRGSDSGLWQKTYNGGWSGWTPIAM